MSSKFNCRRCFDFAKIDKNSHRHRWPTRRLNEQFEWQDTHLWQQRLQPLRSDHKLCDLLFLCSSAMELQKLNISPTWQTASSSRSLSVVFWQIALSRVIFVCFMWKLGESTETQRPPRPGENILSLHLYAALLINLHRRGNGGAIEDKCHVLKLEFSESLIADFCFRHRIKEFSPCAILIQTRWQLERTSLKAFKLMEKLCNFN